MSDRQARFDDLLFRALALPPEERQGFMASNCEDVDLRSEVLELLRKEEDLGDFLDRPAFAVSPLLPGISGDDRVSVALAEGAAAISRIGPYTILEPIGSGGMGDVYLAEQQKPIYRRVAIKLMKTSLASSEALARFSTERQAMARLGHPHVAQIFDGGTTEDGHPFFVMEHVPGVPITQYCDRTALSIEERLGLFLEICAGVQHAHLNQILHRDLKPANILVSEIDGKPAVKIIDFGIAKALDQPLTENTLLTGHSVLGTPAYLSPESLGVGSSGMPRVDTRTDVYSIGIVLYELLAGTNPFKAEGSLASIFRQICETDPPQPSQKVSSLTLAERTTVADLRRIEPAELPAKLAGDLDWIVQKAIAKKPDDRYASAAELAADIERHLSHEPVLARPQTLRYRLGKLARRYRVVATALGIALLALLAGVVGTTYGLLSARQEAADAQQARDESEAVVDFLTGLFSASDPRGVPNRQGGRPEEATAWEILERGRQQIPSQWSGQPKLQARIMAVIANVYEGFVKLDEAQALYEAALAILEREDPADGLEIAHLFSKLGYLAEERGELDRAQDLQERALAIRQKLLPTDAPEMAASLQGLGAVASTAGRFAEAEAFLLRALAIRETQPGEQHELATLLNDIANLYWFMGQHDKALPLRLRTVDLMLEIHGEEHLRVATVLDNLGVLYAQSDQLDKAEKHFERASQIREKLLRDDHPDIARGLNNLAVLYRDLGRPEESEPLHRRALAIREAAYGPDHPWVAWSLQNLGDVMLELGRWVEARPLIERSLKIREKALGASHPDVAESLIELGQLEHAEGRLPAAEAAFRRALEIRFASFGEATPDVAWALYNLADILIDSKQLDEAEQLLRRALAIFEEGDSGRVRGLRFLARSAQLRAQDERAENLLKEALELAPKGKTRQDLITDYASLLRSAGRLAEAGALEPGGAGEGR